MFTKRSVHKHGGVERVVRNITAELASQQPEWDITVQSVFGDSAALERINGVSDVVAAVRLAWRLPRADGDVFFVHCPECLWLFQALRRATRWRSRGPVIAVWHGASPSRELALRPPGDPLARALAWFRSWEERGAVQTDAHVVVHDAVERELRRHHGLESPVTRIPNALDSRTFDRLATPCAPKCGGRFTAVWIGQSDHGKGLDVALRAVAAARRSVPQLRLLIAGVAPREEIDGVEWLGVIAPDEVVSLYHQADVLLFPTRYEAFGLVVLEAMAAGLPVVVSDAVPTGLVRAGRNGFVIAGHHPDDYATALVRLHTDPAMREAMEQANRVDSKSYSVRTAAGRYAALAAEQDAAARRQPVGAPSCTKRERT